MPPMLQTSEPWNQAGDIERCLLKGCVDRRGCSPWRSVSRRRLEVAWTPTRSSSSPSCERSHRRLQGHHPRRPHGQDYTIHLAGEARGGGVAVFVLIKLNQNWSYLYTTQWYVDKVRILFSILCQSWCTSDNVEKKNYKFSDYTIEPHLYRKYTYIFITFYFTELRIGEFDLLDFDIPYFKLSSRPDA